MKKQKTYKSLNTVFEKVKLGAINTVTTKKFSNINYFKKNEIIKPYLHNIDERILDGYISNHITNIYTNRTSSSIFNKFLQIENNKRYKQDLPNLDFKHLKKSISDVYKKFPKEIGHDIFNQYYTDVTKIKYQDRTGLNKNRYRFLDKSNDPVSKVITKQSHVKSMVYARNTIEYYMYMLALLKMTDTDKYEKMMNNLNNNQQQESQQQNNQQNNQQNDEQNNQQNNQQNDDGENNDSEQQSISSEAGDNSSLEDIFNDQLNSSALYEEIMDDAKQTCEMIDKLISENEMEKEWSDALINGLGKFDKHRIEGIINELKDIECNAHVIKPFLRKILDKSFSFFNGKEEHIYDEFLNNPIASDILEYEFLHPKLRNIFIEDVQIKDVRKIGKINVYVDISGSMSSSVGIKNVSRLSFAKALILKLKEMDVLKDVYTFNTRIKKRKNDLEDILYISVSGGTSIDTVVKHIIEKDENAIVITDADDYIRDYSDKAYFIGIGDTRFRMHEENIKQYLQNKQLIIFNNQKIYNVNSYGEAIE
jgi:hypothetical protein